MLTALLDAGEQLFSERGFAAVTVNDLARAAGYSVGAFYLRFKDKDSLFHALHEGFCECVRL